MTEEECDKIKFIVMFAFRRLLPPSRRSPSLQEGGFLGRMILHGTATAPLGLSYLGYTTAGLGLSYKKSEIKPGGFVKFLPKAKVKSLRGEILLCKVAVKDSIKHLVSTLAPRCHPRALAKDLAEAGKPWQAKPALIYYCLGGVVL